MTTPPDTIPDPEEAREQFFPRTTFRWKRPVPNPSDVAYRLDETKFDPCLHDEIEIPNTEKL